MTGLTVTMILGFLTIVALIVMRFNEFGQTVGLPDTITLPEGETAATFTQGDDWFAIVTDDDEILIYGRASGLLRQRIQITPQ